jgi:hypothetical protein
VGTVLGAVACTSYGIAPQKQRTETPDATHKNWCHMPSSGAYLLSQLSTAPNEHNTHNTCHKRACYKSQIPISRQAIRQHFPDRPSEYMLNEPFGTGESEPLQWKFRHP